MNGKPLVLCILDGWGERAETDGNAIEGGHTPNWHRMLALYPHTLLAASGEAVGLPKGQMGNSEVGHQNIGAGRVVMQLLGLLEHAVEHDEFKTNPHMIKFADALKKSGGTAHVWGLASDGGVHSHISQIISLAFALESMGVPAVVHAVMDGRDTDPESGAGFMKELAEAGLKVATISGRYWAMDRNNNLDRTAREVEAIIAASAPKFSDPVAAVKASYAAGKTDEFMEPVAADWYKGAKPNDGLLIANFRADRVRQIAAALAPHFAVRLGVAEYSEELSKLYDVIFPHEELKNTLGEVLAAHGLKQLRLAETEKYAHVTFFFNGGEEKQFKGEERILIPSPNVATYDLKPEMSAYEITDALEKRLKDFDVVIMNYANGDMVGHTGIWDAALKAVVVVDECIGRVEKAVLALGGSAIITADHGNIERMLDDGRSFTAHTTNPVECVLIGQPEVKSLRAGGKLSDIAPTMLKILGIAKPAEMTGKPLF